MISSETGGECQYVWLRLLETGCHVVSRKETRIDERLMRGRLWTSTCLTSAEVDSKRNISLYSPRHVSTMLLDKVII